MSTIKNVLQFIGSGIPLLVYVVGNLATFAKLTFFDGFHYTWWNWIIVLPINEFLGMIWPIYWLILHPICSALGWR